MGQRTRRLHLVLPGLFGPFSERRQPIEAPRAPVLERLLARADRSADPGVDYIATLFGLFGVEVPPESDLPSAAVSRLADGEEEHGGYWLHADPVHLKADMERLILFHGRGLEVARDEAARLRGLIEAHFREEGWRLEQPAPDRWYLRLPSKPRLVTHPLHEAVGRNLFAFMPEGGDGRRWRGLLNEIQMLLFHADVNEARRARGRPEINGLWLWGGGELPAAGRCAIRRVHAVDPLAAGLARLAGADLRPPESVSEGAGEEGAGLVFRDDLFTPVLDADTTAWRGAVTALEPMLAECASALGRKRWDDLLLYPCNGHKFQVTRACLRRFWRRPRPVAASVERAS